VSLHVHEVRLNGSFVSYTAFVLDGDGDDYDRYWDLGYAASRRGEPFSSSAWKLDKMSRAGYMDGYNAYISDAQRHHRENIGMVD